MNRDPLNGSRGVIHLDRQAANLGCVEQSDLFDATCRRGGDRGEHVPDLTSGPFRGGSIERRRVVAKPAATAVPFERDREHRAGRKREARHGHVAGGDRFEHSRVDETDSVRPCVEGKVILPACRELFAALQLRGNVANREVSVQVDPKWKGPGEGSHRRVELGVQTVTGHRAEDNVVFFSQLPEHNGPNRLHKCGRSRSVVPG